MPDREDLLGGPEDTGLEETGATDGASDEGGQAAESTESKEDWKSAYEGLKSQMEEQNLRVLATLGQIANTRTAPEKPAEKAEPPAQLTADQWKVAQTMPELIPHLVKADLNKDFDDRLGRFEQKLFDRLGRQNVTQNLGNIIKENYSEEIRDPKSEIMAQANEVKRMLEPLLRPEVLNSDSHDQIAVLLSAAMKPGQIAKREVKRSQAREAERAAARSRSSAMGGGNSRSFRSGEPEITEAHEEVAAKLGINLKDEKTKARVLGYMKSERLSLLGTQDLSSGTEG